MRRGTLIAIEGIDGAGTTTQAEMLCQWLNDAGQATHLTCEPSSGPVGTLIREFLAPDRERPLNDAALALLFAADRLDHIHAEIAPRLARGIHVVTDRYVYSSMAYQSLEQEIEWVASINAGAPEPDLTIYTRVSPEVASARRRKRGSEDDLFEIDATQARICRMYDDMFGSQDPVGSSTPDPAGSDALDPAGSGRIRRTRDGSSALMARIDRDPVWAVLDGDLSIDELQRRIQRLVAKTCFPHLGL